MIKFFRRIRYDLMEKNKTGKYLKYAMGEIILVVIGILIALQINTWNSERIANKQMISFLQNMQEDLKIDTLEFGKRIRSLDRSTAFKKKMLSLSNFDHYPMDSLFVLITSRSIDYVINTTTFDKIKSLGFTQISKSQELSKGLDNYYTTKSIALNGFTNWDLESSKDTRDYWFFDQNEVEFNLNQFLIKDKVDIFTFKDSLSNRQSLIKLISEPKGRNYIMMDYVRKQLLLEQYIKINELASDLIGKIENELE